MARLVAAARAVARVAHDHRSADDVLAEVDDAAVTAIALGTLRWYLRLAPAVAQLLAKRPSTLAPEFHALLVVAAHQIVYSRHAAEGVVHASVEAARVLGAPRLAGLANAVLRRFVRERDALLARIDAQPAVRHAHPQWFVDRLRKDWPQRWETVLRGGNERAPMTLRVDLSRVSVDEYLARLATQEIGAAALAWRPGAVVLEVPREVYALPGFADGEVSVQDAGAQVAAAWLAPRPGERVLDACAAPGGKTAHLLEVAGGDIDLLAVDSDAVRLEAVTATLQRVRRRARVLHADLRGRAALASERPFERILVDAPCSATGVIRRHPDIKLLRRGRDVAGFVATQRAILENAFERLAPGGRLLYSTCSVITAENEALIGAFLEVHSEAASEPPPPDLAWPDNAIVGRFGVQLLPGPRAPTDGFYYASLTRPP